MNDPRTVTIRTQDHGDVTIPEPSWCLGDHPTEGYREDIEHAGEPVRLVVDTACHGEIEVLSVALFQRPFSTHGPTQPMAVAELDDWHEFDAAKLAGFADTLTSFAAGPLHAVVERLRLLEGSP
ncbi:DUF6907 domain-containing protein [Streptomyces sp. NPDC001315]|uniref:DUF6907 domain-containing protein n=1 Tax=Streptomyces sp. NPDC001315 TaxID=3364562 RepID=UPI0036A0E5F2